MRGSEEAGGRERLSLQHCSFSEQKAIFFLAGGVGLVVSLGKMGVLHLCSRDWCGSGPWVSLPPILLPELISTVMIRLGFGEATWILPEMHMARSRYGKNLTWVMRFPEASRT